MTKEIELTVYGVDHDAIITKLNECGATFVGKYYFRAVNFQIIKKNSITSIEPGNSDEQYYTRWARVRTDGIHTTLTLKEQKGTSMTERNEYEVSVNDFLKTVKIIMMLNSSAKYSYIESEREEYKLGKATIDLNKRPHLPYSIEIEAQSLKTINDVYKKLEIKKEPMKSIAVDDREFYALFGIDYREVELEYTTKLKKMLEELNTL